ncbi:TolC family outer membrane protein [Ruegeria atlantica]|jgi:outer membrane protein|uniref:TolC family outer membrane protein n=1 Tax=Ruegeria atlantica TaxID=81569 RepID=A0AA91BQK8_9RHOB|nr:MULTISPECIES: TolC family outer membrane protein [Ruegeria]NOC81854.1 TolC family outer membrane protein [Ruegeria sp. HKCCD6428]NOC92907.1 TolC family outer membrane protein [Ruegeria sp. HKCCD6604]NOD29952.1 TolC family outer membrane protein [Ruegeria atlantica]NOE17667.1 TolC family outer membrane protein [Ruegeria atlantica]
MRGSATGKLVRAFAVTAGLAISVMPGRPVWADNITDAFIGAYNTSGLLEQNRALLRAADEDVAIALSALRPIINWTVQVSQDYTRSRTNNVVTTTEPSRFFTGLGLTQLLYDGGASVLGKQSAQETVLSTRQTLIDIEQQVLIRAANAYLGVLLQEETVAIRQNNVDVSAEELRASNDRFEVGEVTRTDVALSEAQLASSQADLAVARGELSIAQAEYVNAVGKAPGRTAGQPSLPNLPRSEAEAISLAQRNHPAILSAQHQVRAFDLIVQQQRANLGPNVSLNADAGVRESYDNNDYVNDATVSLDFTQPIYAGGRLAANVRRAMANRDASRANLLNVQKNITQGVTDRYAAFQAASASLRASTERVRASQVAFDGIREEATLGARTTLDVLNAQQDLLDAQLAEVASRTERSRAAYQLLQAQGLLTAERLGLAVQIYDPTLYYNLVKKAPARVSKQSKDLDRVLKALRRD